jgi:hypothetical protein
MVASRSEEAIVRDLTGGEDEVERSRLQRTTLQHLATSLDEVSGVYRRRLRDREGIDLDRLVDEAHRATA